MKKLLRALTARERELLVPFVARHIEAQRAVQVAGQDMVRALELAEPRFGEPQIQFDTSTLEFYEETPDGKGGEAGKSDAARSDGKRTTQ